MSKDSTNAVEQGAEPDRDPGNTDNDADQQRRHSSEAAGGSELDADDPA